jgi:hypothetical protein
MKRLGSIVLLLAIVAFGSWLLVSRRTQPSARDSSERPNPSDSPAGAAGNVEFDAQAADSIRSLREQLDATVWADEVLAQEYEDTFVRLWDALRKREDRDVVLAGFAFGKLRLGQLSAAVARACDVRVRTFDGTARDLTHADWQALVRQLVEDGYRLEQCEFHHETFERREPAPVSTFKIVLHVRNATRRFVVSGALRVHWSAAPEASGQHVPDHIDARGLTLTERSGEPSFTTLTELESAHPERGEVQPVLVYDLDGDGLSEIVMVGANTVYWNRGAGRFEPRELCRRARPRPTAAVLADFNGDALVDLMVAGEQDHAFVYVGEEHGAFNAPPRRIANTELLTKPFAVTAGDVDDDGDLDAWISQYKQPYLGGQMPTPYYDANDGFPSYLLVNQGNLQFEDGTEAAGLAPKRFRRTYANSFVDLDDDGDLDLLVSADFAGVDVYANDGHGRFTDVTEIYVDERENFAMSHAFGDFNGDARLDFYVTGMSSTTARRLEQLGLGRDDYASHQEFRMRMGYGNRMYLGVGGGKYEQAPFNDLVARTGWSWGVTTLDVENDGDLDLYVANGHQSRDSAKDYCTRFWCHDIYTGNSQESPQLASFFSAAGMQVMSSGMSWNGFEHNRLLVNEGGGSFLEVGYLMNAAFEFDARAVISDDLDADGRVDLLVVQAESLDPNQPLGERVHVVRNQSSEPHNWIGVRISNSRPGRPIVGARVVVHTATGSRVAQIVNGDSFRAQHSNTRHFGLGNVDHVDAIEVTWRDGSVSRLDAPAINQYHSVD